MHADLKKLYRQVHTLHQRLFVESPKYTADVTKMAAMSETSSLVDTAYVLRELQKLLKSMQSELGKLDRNVQMIVCMRWSQGTSMEPIRTTYCTAMPDIKERPRLPKKDSPEEAKLLAELGIPETAASFVRPSFDGVSEHITERQAMGRPPLESSSELGTFTEYVLTIRAKRGILEDE